MLPVLAVHAETARTKLPADVFEYYQAGSGDEITVSESVDAWSRFRLRPWPLRDVADVSTAIGLLGTDLSTPVAVAPSAFHRLAHPQAELASMAGAAAAGSLFVLSTRASMPLAELGRAATGPWWFQVYVMQDRDLTAKVVADAVAAGASALVLTGDTPFVGRKHRVQGVRIPIPDDHFLVNITRHLPGDADGRSAAAQDPAIGLETIGWLKRLSGLPVLVKGVLRGDAAVDCLTAGADGIIVSNHGGRQLDRAVPSALALREVVTAVAGRAPVLVDGGLRTGIDVLIALSLGASAVLIGRPILWGLAADGVQGVRQALEALTDDLRHGLALAGVADVRAVSPDLVVAA